MSSSKSASDITGGPFWRLIGFSGLRGGSVIGFLVSPPMPAFLSHSPREVNSRWILAHIFLIGSRISLFTIFASRLRPIGICASSLRISLFE
jgi:hypothetical protein